MTRFSGWLLFGLVSLSSFAAWGSTNAPRAADGRDLYNARCYFCHGYSGDARTQAASYLKPPPVDFTRANPRRLTSQYIVDILENGRPGTAMKSFSGILNSDEMQRLANFVVEEFVERKAVNTRYHTPQNGWDNHDRYRSAYPFISGEIPLSRSWESLTPEQVAGKRLYLSSCISCHDSGAAEEPQARWEGHPLSFPRNQYSPSNPPLDAMTSASPYAKHDVAKKIVALTRLEKRGERLFQSNCAFCHGADGTGKNWIGSFLEPHPRNLTDVAAMSGMSKKRLTEVIREGLPGTSMPAWKAVLRSDDIRAIVAYVGRAFYPLVEAK